MRPIFIAFGFLALLGFGTACAPPEKTLALNEVMPRNGITITDSAGENDDWVEIVNLSDVDAELDGFTLGDLNGAGPFAAGTVVPAGGFLVVFADDALDAGTPEEPHFPFKLSGAGDTITLRDEAGAIVDGFDFPEVAVDVSYGRVPDGTGAPAELAAPTPRRSN